ncbi:ClpP/crotonase-like domain-containing protein [Hyaloraphidium curvatum]|nr:ClpP/crotonase-like domain-containing protein [Hyaloraphidium curvatum]
MAAPAPNYTFETLRTSFPAPFVLHVEINRPTSLNAFNPTFWAECKACFERVADDPDVRAVVLSGGDSRIFTAGLDIKAFQPGAARAKPVDPARDAYRRLKHLKRDIQDPFIAIEECDKPVVAAVHSTVIGAGCEMIAACDIRYATEDARFSVKEVDIGIAADSGGLQRISKISGSDSFVREIVFTARFFSAAEAERHGFVSRILKDKAACVAAAVETAKLIAEKSPVATLGSKHIMNWSRDRTVRDGLHYTNVWSAIFQQTEDMGKAALANAKKTTAEFAKL